MVFDLACFLVLFALPFRKCNVAGGCCHRSSLLVRIAAMHHHIDLRVQGGGMVVFCVPVGHNKILVAPLTAQNIGDKVAAAARVGTVELISTRH